ncbi:MAG: hypothetical protein J0L78_11050 [Planctomycetes bacterium]|nr:hypothetical protein [Planctomycetota bacterium]
MLCRLTGKLESVHETAAVIASPDGSSAREVLLPAYVAKAMASRVGQTVTFSTLEYLEGQGQGTSFIPRLIGFTAARDRAFFEVFTTVKGIGNKKALRAMAVEPAAIARAIASKDAAALVKLPEIGKRMAETIIAELHGKVESFLSEQELGSLEIKSGSMPSVTRLSPIAEEAVTVLTTLGETRGEAERRVALAQERAIREGKPAPRTVDEMIAAVFAIGR